MRDFLNDNRASGGFSSNILTHLKEVEVELKRVLK